MQPSRHTTYFELVEAIQRGGCPVCELVERSVQLQLDSLSYEQVNDPGIRSALRAAHGFCRRHAWQFLQLGGAVFGAAIIYADILRSIQRRLPELHGRGAGSGGLLGSLFGSGPRQPEDQSAGCPVCDTEAGAVSTTTTLQAA